jgi:hypothetical protein
MDKVTCVSVGLIPSKVNSGWVEQLEVVCYGLGMCVLFPIPRGLFLELGLNYLIINSKVIFISN